MPDKPRFEDADNALKAQRPNHDPEEWALRILKAQEDGRITNEQADALLKLPADKQESEALGGYFATLTWDELFDSLSDLPKLSPRHIAALIELRERTKENHVDP